VRSGFAAIFVFAALIVGIYFFMTQLGGWPVVEPHIGGKLP
jgi:hypothetical protein